MKENVYAIATFDVFSGTLKLEIIEASSEIEALKKAECYKNEQVDWDNIDLKKELESKSIVKLSEELGCSDGAIHKRLKKLGLK